MANFETIFGDAGKVVHHSRAADHDTSRETGAPGCVLEVSRLIGLQRLEVDIQFDKFIKIFRLSN